MGLLSPGGSGGAGGSLDWVTEADWDFVAIRAAIGSDLDLVPGTEGTKTDAEFPHDLELKKGTNELGTVMITANGLEMNSSAVAQTEENGVLLPFGEAMADYLSTDIIRVLVLGSSNVDDAGDRPPNNSRWGLSVWADDDASDPNITLHNRFNGSAAESFLQRRDGLSGGTNDAAATSPADSEYTILAAIVLGPFVEYLAGRGESLPDWGDLAAPPNGDEGTWSQIDDDALVQPGITPVLADAVGITVKKATANTDTIDVVVPRVVIQRLKVV